MRYLRTLILLVVYPALHIPLFLICIWPLVAGMMLGWGTLTFAIWLLWCIPFGILVIRLDQWRWWRETRDELLAWGR